METSTKTCVRYIKNIAIKCEKMSDMKISPAISTVANVTNMANVTNVANMAPQLVLVGPSTTTTNNGQAANDKTKPAQQPKIKKEKAKRKNSEKRKEKSRKAARERRSQEAKIFDEIEQILPVSSKILDNLDKASLVRIAINYLKIRSVVDPFQVPNIVDAFDLSEASILNTLNGFMFVLSKDGDIIYLSDNVERFLGLTHIDLMGQSIYDYSHPCDHDDIKSFLEPLNNAFNASHRYAQPTNNATPTSTNAPPPSSSSSTAQSSSSSSTSNSSSSSSSNQSQSSSSSSSANNKSTTKNSTNNGQAVVEHAQIINETSSKCPEKAATAEISPKRRRLIEAIGEAVGPYFIRMKCTLSNKGRNLNLKSANYKVIKCCGRMIDLEVASPLHSQMIGENYHHYMIAVAEVIQHPIRIEIPLKSDVFITKHTPDMKFAYVDESVKDLFGYNVNDLIGKSFYQYFDANDFTQLSVLFKTLFAKGQCDFGQYKFLAKTGGYRWISTQATIINEPNVSQPQSIILIHRVISNIQDGHQLTSDVQQQQQTKQELSAIIPTQPTQSTRTAILNNTTPVSSTTSSIIKPNIKQSPHSSTLKNNNNCHQVPELSSSTNNVTVPNVTNSTAQLLKVNFKIKEEKFEVEEPIPVSIANQQEEFISSTETVLAPKTADMESGFLVFTEDNKGLTVLSDADDLTHLAPDAGDLCVPMLPDMDFADMNLFDEIFLNSNSYNITTAGFGADDEFLNNIASLDNDKLKLDSLDSAIAGAGNGSGFNLELDQKSSKYPNENLLGLNNIMKDIKNNGGGYGGQQYPLDMNSNDPFLSFTNTNDEFLITNSPTTTRSDCSMNDSSSISFSSSQQHSPLNSSSSNSLQEYSPKSISGDETSMMMNKLINCDNNQQNDEKDLEMRAPFIPIDDDYLLNDFSYSNLDDLFDWISNNNNDAFNQQQNYSTSSNNNNKPNSESYQHQNSNKKNKIPKLSGGCLEALLQNDELICNLKNKMYSSNQILNRNLNHNEQQQHQMHQNLDSTANNNNNCGTIVQQQQMAHHHNHQNSNQQAMKRKNSNIFVYTTMSHTGEKKIKNLILTHDIPAHKLQLNGAVNHNANQTNNPSGANQPNNQASIHHFVLTKNNELIPKVTFVNQQQPQQQQSFKVPKRMMMMVNHQHDDLQTQQQPPHLVSGNNGLVANIQSQTSTNASGPTTNNDNVFKKPRSSESSNTPTTLKMNNNYTPSSQTTSTSSSSCSSTTSTTSSSPVTSNSVLLNLLVNGSDLSNGYELTQHAPPHQPPLLIHQSSPGSINNQSSTSPSSNHHRHLVNHSSNNHKTLSSNDTSITNSNNNTTTTVILNSISRTGTMIEQTDL